MLPIVKLPGFVENILPRFSSIFNKAQLRHFGEYLTGLMVSENKTVTGINSQFLNHTDQSFNQENYVDQVFRIAMKGNPQSKIVF